MLDMNRHARQIEVRDRYIMALTYVIATLIIAIGVLVAKIAYGEALPYPKGKTQCAAGYRDSGGYCVPMNDKAKDAVPKVGACPSNWHQSGGACVRNK